MNYGYNKEKGTRTPIEYVCLHCSFSTFKQSLEQIHYSQGHYLSSKLRIDLEESDPDNVVQTKVLRYD